MEIGVFAKTFAGNSPSVVLAAAKGAGFSSVQYNMACSGLSSLPIEIADAAALAVADASRDTGIRIAAVSATYNMIHPVPERREQGRRAFEAIAAAAPIMGARIVTLCTGSADPVDQWRHHPDNGSPASWRMMLDEFEYLVPLAERYDLMLGVEPELGNVVSTPHVARALIDTLGSDRIGIVLDPANLFEVETAPRRDALIAEAIALLGDRIVLAHAKDRDADGRVAPAGQGAIDFQHFLARLRAVGFDGPVIAHGFEAPDAPGVAAFLNRLLHQPEAA